ncbi:hypothetical protein Hanom_Chr00s002892g01706671 [Helianthus anomalus]
MRMTTKLKLWGSRFKRFEFWTKVVKVIKSQGPFWQFTHLLILCYFQNYVYFKR